MDVTLGNHQGYMYSASSAIITDGITAQVAGNAFLKVRSNQGINVGNLRQGVIRDNLILSGTPSGGNGIFLIGWTALGQVGVHDLLIDNNYILGLRGLMAYGASISDVSVRNNQFRAANTEVVSFGDYNAGAYSFTGNAYYSQRQPNRWFLINGGTGYIDETGAMTASFVDPALAPDIETYHASIGGEASLAAFLDIARRQWERHWCDDYTAAAVIQYLRQQLGLQ